MRSFGGQGVIVSKVLTRAFPEQSIRNDATLRVLLVPRSAQEIGQSSSRNDCASTGAPWTQAGGPSAKTQRTAGPRGISGTRSDGGGPKYLIDECGHIYRVATWAKAADSARLPSRFIAELLSQSHRVSAEFSHPVLTAREREIVCLLASRATNNEIAEELGISRHTARHHTQSVLAKLGLKSRARVRAWFLDALGRSGAGTANDSGSGKKTGNK